MKKKGGSQCATFGVVCEKLSPLDRLRMSQLAELDAESSPMPWSASKYKQELSRPFVSCFGVRTGDGDLLGYATVREGESSVTLTDMLVGVNHRRKGIGRLLIDCVRKRCVGDGAPCIEAVVEDRYDSLHFFFKKCGFRAVKTFYDRDPEGRERCFYLFRWTQKGK